MKPRVTHRAISLTLDGTTKTLTQWAKDLGIPYQTVIDRYKRVVADLPASPVTGRVQIPPSYARDILRQPTQRTALRGDPLKYFSDDEIVTMQLLGDPDGENLPRTELRRILKDSHRRGRMTHALRAAEEPIPEELRNLTDTLFARMGVSQTPTKTEDPFKHMSMDELHTLKEAANAKGLTMRKVRIMARDPEQRSKLFKLLNEE